MLFKVKHTIILILYLIVLNSCQTRWATSSFRKPKQNKEQERKDRSKAKKKEEYRQYVEKKRKKNYDIQSESAKERWDENNKKSDSWRKEEFHNKGLGYRIRKFFDNFRREPKPDNGLFSKKQMRRSKGNIFQRIFKKIKRKK